MELLVASAIGIMTAAGTYLVLRKRTFPVIIGLSLLTYAVNVFLFASGRLAVGRPPILRDEYGDEAGYAGAGAGHAPGAPDHGDEAAAAADGAAGDDPTAAASAEPATEDAAQASDLADYASDPAAHVAGIAADAAGAVATYTDPLPQALVLTAIVISFGMTAVLVVIALAAFLSGDDDHVDGISTEPPR